MSRIKFSNHPIHVGNTRVGIFDFIPTGKIMFVSEGSRNNPDIFRSKETWAARIIVGLSIKGRRRSIPPQSIISYVKAYCKFAGLDPSSSYLMQKGVYQYSGGGRVVTENSMQIILLNLNADLHPGIFQMYMEYMAEDMGVDFKQESIVMEIQRNGVVQITIGKSPTF